jgi:hypothetical protein
MAFNPSQTVQNLLQGLRIVDMAILGVGNPTGGIGSLGMEFRVVQWNNWVKSF